MQPTSLLPILTFGAALAGASASAEPIYRVTSVKPGDADGYIYYSGDGSSIAFAKPATGFTDEALDYFAAHLEPEYAYPTRNEGWNVYGQFSPKWMNVDGYVGGELVWYEAPSFNPRSFGRIVRSGVEIRKFDEAGQLQTAWGFTHSSYPMNPPNLSPMNSANQFGYSYPNGEKVWLVDLDTKEHLDLSWIAADGTLRQDYRWGNDPGLMPGAWRLDEIVAIDETGKILAKGHNSEGYDGLVMVTPVPEPATIWAFALIAGGLGIRRLKQRASGWS